MDKYKHVIKILNILHPINNNYRNHFIKNFNLFNKNYLYSLNLFKIYQNLILIINYLFNLSYKLFKYIFKNKISSINPSHKSYLIFFNIYIIPFNPLFKSNIESF